MGGDYTKAEVPGGSILGLPCSWSPHTISSLNSLHLAYYLGISVFKFRKERNNWLWLFLCICHLHILAQVGCGHLVGSICLWPGEVTPQGMTGSVMTESFVQKVKWGHSFPAMGPQRSHAARVKAYVKFYSSRLDRGKEVFLFSFAHSLYLRSREKGARGKGTLETGFSYILGQMKGNATLQRQKVTHWMPHSKKQRGPGIYMGLKI